MRVVKRWRLAQRGNLGGRPRKPGGCADRREEQRALIAALPAAMPVGRLRLVSGHVGNAWGIDHNPGRWRRVGQCAPGCVTAAGSVVARVRGRAVLFVPHVMVNMAEVMAVSAEKRLRYKIAKRKREELLKERLALIERIAMERAADPERRVGGGSAASASVSHAPM